jgi:PTH1 family peptidyl-tRNA hydrolase
MHLIIGLGNIGEKYAHTRHNVGFDALDLYALSHGMAYERVAHHSMIAKKKELILAKPTTFMNLSGQAVFDLTQFYKVSVDELLIIYDDMDFNVGVVKIRKSGSPGSHNGMKDIIYRMNDQNIPRVRIGIGKVSGASSVEHVLGRFSSEERVLIERALKRTVNIIDEYLDVGIDKTMNKFNSASFEDEGGESSL